MKPALLVFLSLLLGAAPPPGEVPVGSFQTWGVHPAVPLVFRSGGLVVSVAAQPCLPKPQTEGCRFDGVNNQATITVTAPGLPPFSMTSDRQASFVRVAAVHLDRRDPRLGVVVDNQWGGSGGLTALTVVEPTSGGFRAVPLHRADGAEIEGQIDDSPRDRSGDGVVDYVMEDSHFDSTFGCNGCSPRPPLVLSAVDGHSIDLSTSAAVQPIFAADMIRVRAVCDSGRADRNGSCAAYVADAARLGRVAAAWRDMLVHQDPHDLRSVWQRCTASREPDGRCPPGAETHFHSFPESLRAFLVATGYISRAEAAALSA